MKSLVTIVAALVCLACVGTAWAGDQHTYFNLGLAWADPDYGDEVNTLFDAIADQPQVDHITVGVDLGLYFAMGQSAMFGPALTGIGDRYELNGDAMQVNQYLIGGSYRYYMSGERGKGVFLRGDAGGARMVLDIDGLDTVTSDWGFGFLVGGGISFQIGGGTWFSINADYTQKTIEDETVGGVTVGGAFLF